MRVGVWADAGRWIRLAVVVNRAFRRAERAFRVAGVAVGGAARVLSRDRRVGSCTWRAFHVAGVGHGVTCSVHRSAWQVHGIMRCMCNDWNSWPCARKLRACVEVGGAAKSSQAQGGVIVALSFRKTQLHSWRGTSQCAALDGHCGVLRRGAVLFRSLKHCAIGIGDDECLSRDALCR